jgi:transposase-like protein
LKPVDDVEGSYPPDHLQASSKIGAPTPVGKVRPVLTVVAEGSDGHDDQALTGLAGASASLIDEIVREGARRMLAEALQAEVDAYIARFVSERDENGRRLVVRNGSHQSREVLTSAGAVEVVVPRVNDRRVDPQTGQRVRFCSVILPPWCRKTPKITEVLPLLYLHGLSSGDFVPALGQFLGSTAGLSGPVITKLTETWKTEQRAFSQRDLSHVDYVYLWADGVHVNIRLEEHKLCLLVMIGVRADGRKELVAVADGYRESTESWSDLLRDAARRGMRAPVLAVGDGALGFWAALREVFPGTREQRCWFHKIGNVLAAMPRSAHPGAKKALAESTGQCNTLLSCGGVRWRGWDGRGCLMSCGCGCGGCGRRGDRSARSRVPSGIRRARSSRSSSRPAATSRRSVPGGRGSCRWPSGRRSPGAWPGVTRCAR